MSAWAALRDEADRAKPGGCFMARTAEVLALLDERDRLERERDDNGYGWLGCQQERDQAVALLREIVERGAPFQSYIAWRDRGDARAAEAMTTFDERWNRARAFLASLGETALSDDLVRCGSWSSAFDVACTRLAGHVGQHVATDANHLALAVWESLGETGT